jgi:hypothetical protein
MDGMRQRRRVGGDGDDDTSKQSRKPRITLETFDLYTKVQAEEQIQTSSGAGVTMVSLIVIVILVLNELYGYLVPKQAEHMAVDQVIEGRLRINLDITFHALTCADVNVDAMDVAGEQQNGLHHDIQKIRLTPEGTPVGDSIQVRLDQKSEEPTPTPLPEGYCGSCYGAQMTEGQCCNTCDDVRNIYAERGWDVAGVTASAEQCVREKRNPEAQAKAGEGCRIQGFMLVNKVAGNFHIAMGETHTRGAGHIHQFNPHQFSHFNVSHTIHSLSFGEFFPGRKSPLEGLVRVPNEGSGAFMYWLQVVPTVYLRKGTEPLVTNQYSMTSQFTPAILNGQRQNILPGVFFVYDISPFMVTVTESTTPFAQLVTSLCAILGGVVTVATVIDAVLYRLGSAMKGKKMGGGAAQPGSAASLIQPGGTQGQLVDAIASAVGTVAQQLASPGGGYVPPAARMGPPPTAMMSPSASSAHPATSPYAQPHSPAAPSPVAYAGGSDGYAGQQSSGNPAAYQRQTAGGGYAGSPYASGPSAGGVQFAEKDA